MCNITAPIGSILLHNESFYYSGYILILKAGQLVIEFFFRKLLLFGVHLPLAVPILADVMVLSLSLMLRGLMPQRTCSQRCIFFLM